MAVTCASKLASEGVVGIIGPFKSTNAMAVESVLTKNGVVALVGGTSPTIEALGNEYLFRARASDTIFAQVAGMYAHEKFGAKKIAMFYNNDEFGTGALGIVEQYCKDNGVERCV